MKIISNRGGQRSKGICDHPYKKIQKAPKIPPKSPFFKSFVYEIVKAPATNRTATMASPPLISNHIENYHQVKA
jgi:hypothetical protein